VETTAFLKGFLHFLLVKIYKLTCMGPHQLELLRNSLMCLKSFGLCCLQTHWGNTQLHSIHEFLMSRFTQHQMWTMTTSFCSLSWWCFLPVCKAWTGSGWRGGHNTKLFG